MFHVGSAGDWNSVTFYTPHNKLLTHESQMSEFEILSEMGVAGINGEDTERTVMMTIVFLMALKVEA